MSHFTWVRRTLVFIEEVEYLFTSPDDNNNMCIYSHLLSSTERRTHRPQVEETTSHVKSRADPAEEQRGAEVVPVGVKAESKDLCFI